MRRHHSRPSSPPPEVSKFAIVQPGRNAPPHARLGGSARVPPGLKSRRGARTLSLPLWCRLGGRLRNVRDVNLHTLRGLMGLAFHAALPLSENATTILDVRAWLSHKSSGDVLRPDDGPAGPLINIAHHADESSFKKRRCPTQTETMARGHAGTSEDITRS